ncbi:hypothetical protein HN51_016605 [Arachis hypogaea]
MNYFIVGIVAALLVAVYCSIACLGLFFILLFILLFNCLSQFIVHFIVQLLPGFDCQFFLGKTSKVQVLIGSKRWVTNSGYTSLDHIVSGFYSYPYQILLHA